MDTFVSAPELLLHMSDSRATKLMIDPPSPPTFFHGERLLPDRDYPQCLSSEDCRMLVHSLLTAEQRERLDTDHWIWVIVDGPGKARYRVFATSRDGVVSAVITA